MSAHSCDKSFLPNPRSSFDPVVPLYYYIERVSSPATPLLRGSATEKQILRSARKWQNRNLIQNNHGGICEGEGVIWRYCKMAKTFVTLQCIFGMLSPWIARTRRARDPLEYRIGLKASKQVVILTVAYTYHNTSLRI